MVLRVAKQGPEHSVELINKTYHSIFLLEVSGDFYYLCERDICSNFEDSIINYRKN